MISSILLASLVALLLLLTRPLATSWPETVGRMRDKQPDAAGSLQQAIKPLQVALRDRQHRWQHMGDLARSQSRIGISADDEDERIWAADAVLFTVGCTHKRCFLGVLGKWRRMWSGRYDLYGLAAAHGAACLVANQYGPGYYHRLFSPRFSSPVSLVLGIFATSSPFELVWLSGSILGVGAELQRSLGRGAFLMLYCGGALASSLVAAYSRHSANGAAGALATFAFHALAAPSARHSIFGLEMGARNALLAQAALSTWPMLNGGRPATACALNAVPIAMGGILFRLLRAR